MELEQQIRDLVAPLDGEGTPGGVIGVARKGVLELVVPFGHASLEHGVRNTRESVFYIASTSKQYVAAAAALLELDGVISADDPIGKWLPEVEQLGDIRVQHLVHHTSGIRDKYSLYAVGRLPEESISTELGTMRLLAGQRSLNFAPGSRFMYSNSGYALLATLVARASGRSFIDFTNERLFAPMGMTGTRFRDDTSEVIPHRASGYQLKPAGGWRLTEYTWSALGPGGVISTIDSLARWGLVYQGNPHLPAELPAKLMSTVALTDGSASDYGYGVMLDRHGEDLLVHHAGGVAGFSAEMLQLPSQELTIVVMCNTSAGNAPGVARKVLELVVPLAPKTETVGTAAPLDLTALSGTYIDADETTIASVAVEGDQGTLSLAGANLPIVTDERGRTTVSAFDVSIDGDALVLSNPVQVNRFTRVTPATELKADGIAGTYTNAELGVSLIVTEDDKGLRLSWPTGESVELSAVTAEIGSFAHELGVTALVRVLSTDGEVTGLRFNVMRALGIDFLRSS